MSCLSLFLQLCFNCRQSGHLIHECPQSESSETGICFKCGAGDHTSKNCRANVASNEYPYAKCFICDEVGHLSRSCPHNPRGMYPQGTISCVHVCVYHCASHQFHEGYGCILLILVMQVVVVKYVVQSST